MCVPKYIYEYTLYIHSPQISTFSLIAICQSANESPELKLLTKLTPINNAQNEYLDNTRNQGDLVASASDRSKRITILIHIYILSTFIHIFDFMHDCNNYYYYLFIHALIIIYELWTYFCG